MPSTLHRMRPRLAIFDKDGTLIDFHAMWGDWALELARRLELATGMPIAQPLFEALGFDAENGHVHSAGPLAIGTMAGLRALTAELLISLQLPPQIVADALATAWHSPDPVALARPLADLPLLFTTLQSHGLRIAVATTDDRSPTLATLEALGVADLVSALSCGDDGVPVKPAPQMVRTLCGVLGIAPQQALMVGDTVADLEMGRAAGVGMTVGVLSGVADEPELAPHADLLLPSVAALIE